MVFNDKPDQFFRPSMENWKQLYSWMLDEPYRELICLAQKISDPVLRDGRHSSALSGRLIARGCPGISFDQEPPSYEMAAELLVQVHRSFGQSDRKSFSQGHIDLVFKKIGSMLHYLNDMVSGRTINSAESKRLIRNFYQGKKRKNIGDWTMMRIASLVNSLRIGLIVQDMRKILLWNGSDDLDIQGIKDMERQGLMKLFAPLDSSIPKSPSPQTEWIWFLDKDTQTSNTLDQEEYPVFDEACHLFSTFTLERLDWLTKGRDDGEIDMPTVIRFAIARFIFNHMQQLKMKPQHTELSGKRARPMSYMGMA